jgi:hypothetical protein
MGDDLTSEHFGPALQETNNPIFFGPSCFRIVAAGETLVLIGVQKEIVLGRELSNLG